MFRTLPLFLLILFPFFLSAQDWKTLSADDSKLTELRSAL
ncbi:MAG: hypothetical protein ACI9Z7_001636, partial [Alteromonas macleodii]